MSDEKTCTASVEYIPTHLLDSTPSFMAHIAKQTAERLTHALAEKIHDGEEYIVRMTPVHWEQNESICEVSAKRELVMKPLTRCKDCKHTPRSDSNDYWCDKWEREFGSDWFCADGERKDG